MTRYWPLKIKAQGQSWEEAGIQIQQFEERWANNDDYDIQTHMGLIVKDMTEKKKSYCRDDRDWAQLLLLQTLHIFDLCLEFTHNCKAKETQCFKLYCESLIAWLINNKMFLDRVRRLRTW